MSCLLRPRWPRLLLTMTIILLLCVAASAGDGNWTAKHEKGRCAMKGQCGKKSFFGGQLPCPNNTLAEEPEKDVRKKLVDVCGGDWDEEAICCDEDQVMYLGSKWHLLALTGD